MILTCVTHRLKNILQKQVKLINPHNETELNMKNLNVSLGSVKLACISKFCPPIHGWNIADTA